MPQVREHLQLAGRDLRSLDAGHPHAPAQDVQARRRRGVVLGELRAGGQRDDGLAQRAVVQDELGAAAVRRGARGLEVVLGQIGQVGHGAPRVVGASVRSCGPAVLRSCGRQGGLAQRAATLSRPRASTAVQRRLESTTPSRRGGAADAATR
ncbi:hypothetical protein [Cellulomonas sp. ATA003]|uniref:hypothetical protein n=1 Tax=Cellulomonas sp. ATA003 TaxID=3073064 RepID=UPI00287329F1|nr:hypothetical protein [Cellulomonas sp. ATA003]WNB85699.1 hypothetical protein REH70_19695 [Cellulomonas sp. ATA003]